MPVFASTYTIYSGIRDTKRLGIMKAGANAPLTGPVPRKCAYTISLSRPSARLTTVAAAMAALDFSIRDMRRPCSR